MSKLKITIGNELGASEVITSKQNLRQVLDERNAQIVEDLMRAMSNIPKCNSIEQRVNGIDYYVDKI